MSKIYYPRYFQPEQKLSLKRAQQSVGDGQYDSMSGTLVFCGDDYFDIRISYGSNEDELYPFFPGMPFELYSDYFGLGLQLTVQYESDMGSNLFRFCPQGNLEFYFRRQYLRAEVMLWAGYLRGLGNLKTLRRRWKRHAERCRTGDEPANLPPVQRLALTLGGGGINLELAAPVEESELCLIYLALKDKGPLVCALAEVVSVGKEDPTGMQTAGLRFLNILDADRRRIDLEVRKHYRESGTEGF